MIGGATDGGKMSEQTENTNADYAAELGFEWMVFLRDAYQRGIRE